ncbi:MAG: acyltransferase [Planctomycetia bacterium]|nr:acyltransferase [Planctomycetia bacterium]
MQTSGEVAFKPGRVAAVDALRGCAALAVLAQHLALFHPWEILPSGTWADAVVARSLRVAADWGGLGVPMFLVLSGYCIGHAWQRSTTWHDFARRRVRRIYPKYLASLPLAMCLGSPADGPLPLVGAWPCDGPGYLAAVATVMTWPATDYRPFQVVYWTLTYEVAFYALLTAALAVPEPLRLGTLVGMAVVGSILTLVPQAAQFPGPTFFCCLWPLFALGLALALARRTPRGACLVAAAALAGLSVVDEVCRSRGYAPTAMVTLAALVLVDRARRPIPVGCLADLGRVSYGLYITHLPVMILVGRLLPASLTLAWAGAAALGTVAAQVSVAIIFRRLLGPPRVTARPALRRP